MIKTFDPPGGSETVPSAINDQGTIAGSYFYGNDRGFLRGK